MLFRSLLFVTPVTPVVLTRSVCAATNIFKSKAVRDSSIVVLIVESIASNMISGSDCKLKNTFDMEHYKVENES